MADAELFRQGMRRLAGGVCLVTAVEQGERHGLVATSVTSVSLEPPTLLVCVNRSASAHDPIARTRRFGVNFLSSADIGIARRFASDGDRSLRFQAGEWRAVAGDLPALASALASFECRVIEAVAAHSHSVFIAEVGEIRLWDEAEASLVYLGGRYRSVADILPPAA